MKSNEDNRRNSNMNNYKNIKKYLHLPENSSKQFLESTYKFNKIFFQENLNLMLKLCFPLEYHRE